MNELAAALIGESAHAAPAHILEALPEALAHQQVKGAPHTIYQELWHIAFWLEMTLNWVTGRCETIKHFLCFMFQRTL